MSNDHNDSGLGRLLQISSVGKAPNLQILLQDFIDVPTQLDEAFSFQTLPQHLYQRLQKI